MSFSLEYFPDQIDVHRRCEKNSIKFPKGSLLSIFIRKKRRLLKQENYLQALEMPYVKSISEKYHISNDDEIISQFWIKANLSDFYYDILFLYLFKVSQICLQKNESYFLIYRTNNIYVFDGKLPNNNNTGYIDKCLEWMYNVLNSKSSLLSRNKKEIENNNRTISAMMKRMFRFYVHVFERHKSIFETTPNLEVCFNTSLSFFVSFGLKYKILSEFEYEPFKDSILPFSEKIESINESNTENENSEPKTENKETLEMDYCKIHFVDN